MVEMGGPCCGLFILLCGNIQDSINFMIFRILYFLKDFLIIPVYD